MPTLWNVANPLWKEHFRRHPCKTILCLCPQATATRQVTKVRFILWSGAKQRAEGAWAPSHCFWIYSLNINSVIMWVLQSFSGRWLWPFQDVWQCPFFSATSSQSPTHTLYHHPDQQHYLRYHYFYCRYHRHHPVTKVCWPLNSYQYSRILYTSTHTCINVL